MIENYLTPNFSKLNIKEIELNAQLPSKSTDNILDIINIFPIVYYEGFVIPLEDIKSFVLDISGFMPTFTMLFLDTSGIMSDKGFPVDDSNITIRIPSRTELYKSIFLQFKILTFSISGENNRSKIMTLTGSLDVNNLYLNQFKSYKNLSSWKCLYEVAKDSGLGFNSNVSDTKDYMTWINPGHDVYQFTQDVMRHSWNGESAFLWSYIDQYYNLNYIDVETALQEDISIDLATAPNNKILNNKSEEQLINLVLSNDPSMQMHNVYFNDFRIINQSSKISLEHGNSKIAYFFDKRGAWNNRAGAFLAFEVDSIITPGSEKNSIILKGKPNDGDFWKNNISFKYIGKIDRSNVHAEYAYSDVQNEQNIYDLQKVSIEIVMPNINMALQKFKKVKLYFSNLYKRSISDEYNAKMSGQWLITGIKYKLNNKRRLEQIVTLVKRELNIDDLKF